MSSRRDLDVQQIDIDACMNKRLVRKRPLAHVRIDVEAMAHRLCLARI
ncbi:MAG: hypothetical protein KGN16_25475 [Burkholderiales bacterium]|nr:hypothetical protein [Burkholderiales bacterium]